MATTITSWNVQGRRRPDLDALAAEVLALGADIVLLQEVQRAQAHGLARRLGWTATWRCKHWPVVSPPEGLAVLAPRRPVLVRRVALAHRLRIWSWKRRIVLRADFAGGSDLPWGDGGLCVLDMHLGVGVGEAERVRQAAIVIDVAGRTRTVIGGDANAGPTSGVIASFASAGFVDGWASRHGADAGPDRGDLGATNWGSGPRTAAPERRIDYVFVSQDQRVLAASTPLGATATSADIARWGARSDHLPVTVTVV